MYPRSSSDRHPHRERRSLARFARDLDVAPVLFNDTIAYRQTQARSLRRVLGRKEGVEDLVQMLPGYPAARIRKDDLDRASRPAGAHLDPARRRDRMYGVQEQVHHHLP